MTDKDKTKDSQTHRDTNGLTHIDSDGNAVMICVADKGITKRIAIATSKITMKDSTFKMITEKTAKKGDVLTIAQIAGINGSKATSSLIPLCHNIVLDKVSVKFDTSATDDDKNNKDNKDNNNNSENNNNEKTNHMSSITITAEAIATGRTGVEMEALTACTVAALTIYDMCKAVDREMVIENTQLIYKDGGKSGTFTRK